jgi:oxygen-independent coproporphyrinogen-3 oxidase
LPEIADIGNSGGTTPARAPWEQRLFHALRRTLHSPGEQSMSTISLPVITPQPSTESCSPSQTPKETTVGNYFVANYPPFGFWKPDHVGALHQAMERPPVPGVDLGLYAHIPFCRKRCHFCYFRVYTDKNSSEIRRYIDALLTELRTLSSKPVIGGRTPSFINFGGGTPSYLSVDQLTGLFAGMRNLLPWDNAREIGFEGEPGTLNELKLRALRELGITRLSLGIEHLDDHILEINGRAHRSKEAYRAYAFAREVGFPQINIDLIAGMVEETEAKWAETVARTIELEPDSVTIYQMEIPYNTTIYQRMKAEGTLVAPVADWETKRRWVDYAFGEFQKAGYTVATATTVVRKPDTEFAYRTGLFNGTDLLSVGVSSFGHISGINYQNQHDFNPYIDAVSTTGMATYRAYPLSRDENYIRELALQLKAGSVSIRAFTEKFGIDPRVRFASALETFRQRGVLDISGDRLGINRAGLLQIDKLMFELFLPEHQTGRFA